MKNVIITTCSNYRVFLHKNILTHNQFFNLGTTSCYQYMSCAWTYGSEPLSATSLQEMQTNSNLTWTEFRIFPLKFILCVLKKNKSLLTICFGELLVDLLIHIFKDYLFSPAYPVILCIQSQGFFLSKNPGIFTEILLFPFKLTRLSGTEAKRPLNSIAPSDIRYAKTVEGTKIY